MLKIDHTKLKPGDVLLTRSQLGLNSAMIRLATWGKFSHASLYLGAGSYMDSTPDGVHSGNLHRLIFAQNNYVKVLRLKDEYQNNNVITDTCEYVRSKFAQEYGKAHAFMSVPWAKAKGTDTQNRAFCSRLVANAFSFSGVTVVENPNFASPEDLNRSAFFEEVIDVTITANEQELNAPFEKGTILEQQKEVTNTLFSEFRNLSGKDIQTFEQAILATIENNALDQKFTKAIEDSEYYDLKNKAFATVPWIKDPKQFIAQGNFKDFDDFKERVQIELRSFTYNLIRYETQRDAFWSLLQDYTSNQFISSLFNFYKALVQDYLIAKHMFNGMLQSNLSAEVAVQLSHK